MREERRRREAAEHADVGVRPAALWGCSAWPASEALLKGINSVQLQLLRRAIGGQRRPGSNGWSGISERCDMHGWRCCGRQWGDGGVPVLQTVWEVHGHVARRDCPLPELYQWRTIKWWKSEQVLEEGGARHAERFCPALDR